MKLRNKQTGEIGTPRVDYQELYVDTENGYTYCYKSLQNMCEEWKDYEEPKEYWYIDYDGGILCGEPDNSSAEKMMISMGNHFETIEEAEKAVEKLKAWKRLKDNGFRFEGRNKPNYGEKFIIECSLPKETLVIDVAEDLDLLFGGEE